MISLFVNSSSQKREKSKKINSQITRTVYTSIKNNQKSTKYYHFVYNPKIEDLFKSCFILKAISLHFKCKLISEYEIIIWYAR